MKIAIYSGSIPSTTFIENLIKMISSEHDIVLFGKLLSNPNYTSKNINCFPIYSNKLKSLLFTKWRTFLLLIKYPKRFVFLWKEVKIHKGFYNKYMWWSRYVSVLLHLPDIFHIQWAKDLENWFFLKEKFNCKLVLSLRGAHINYSPIADEKLAIAYRNFFPKIDAFHSVCNAIKLEAQKYGADEAKILTIHSLIPQTTFNLFKLSNKDVIEKLNIISVGRHHWKKGYNFALQACKFLKEQKIPFTYTIIADGNVPEELIYNRHQMGLINEVNFLGALQQKEVFEFMQKSDVLLLPSLEEGIANVAIEAMALGVLVVSTNCGGMSELVFPEKTGWLVPILDAKLIADSLIEVFNTTLEKRQKIISNAFLNVKENFTQEQVKQQFINFYNNLDNKGQL